MRPPIALAATPIGNDGDTSARLRGELEKADITAAEDTRRPLNLAGRLDIAVRGWVLSFHEHSEADRAPVLLGLAHKRRRVMIASDVGMPSASDPGYRLVALAACSGIDVEMVPGFSAVLTALVISGLVTDCFYFEDSLPCKASELAAAIRGLKSEGRMMVFFESPCHLSTTLCAICEGSGSDRPTCVCGELTKVHQEVTRGSLGELVERFSGEVLGEIVVIAVGAPRKGTGVETLVAEILVLADADLRLKGTTAHVARRVGLRKRDLYDVVAVACTVRSG